MSERRQLQVEHIAYFDPTGTGLPFLYDFLPITYMIDDAVAMVVYHLGGGG